MYIWYEVYQTFLRLIIIFLWELLRFGITDGEVVVVMCSLCEEMDDDDVGERGSEADRVFEESAIPHTAH